MIIEEVYSDLEVEDFLNHHGVKGQKWGVRNSITFTGRTRVRGNRRQSRSARNGKRVVAALLGGPFGLIAYNALSAPLKKPIKKKQSGAAFVTKLIATGILTTPVSAIAYAQIAAPRKK